MPALVYLLTYAKNYHSHEIDHPIRLVAYAPIVRTDEWLCHIRARPLIVCDTFTIDEYRQCLYSDALDAYSEKYFTFSRQ